MRETQSIRKNNWANWLPVKHIKRLINKNYYTARAYYIRNLRRTDERYKAPPLLIHQMGKVASSSVNRSLNVADLGQHIYHTHSLRPEMINKYEKRRRKYLGTNLEGRLTHIWQYRYLYQQLQRDIKSGKKWKVITLIRDPIARNISDFFENIEIIPTNSAQQQKFRSREYDFEITVSDNDLEELIEFFLEKFPHDYPAKFLDLEIKGIFSVDPYESDFPIEKGYKIYEGKQADILLLRVENLNDCYTEAFNQFLGIDNLTLSKNTNIGSQKEYADTYRIFKESIALSESFIDRMYSTDFIQHFYSDSEIQQFKARWLKI